MRSPFSTLTVVCLPLIPLISCSASNSKSPDAKIKLVDSGKAIDAPAPCTAAASYATPTFTYGSAGDAGAQSQGSGANELLGFDGLLNMNTMPDALDILLYAGYGAFSGGDITAMTIDLSGSDETSFVSCGACVRVQTGLHAVGSNVAETDDYEATSGTLTLTAVGNAGGSGTLTGSVSNVKFTHVTYMTNGSGQVTGQTVVGDCMTALGSASFSSAITIVPAAFDGKTLLHGRYR